MRLKKSVPLAFTNSANRWELFREKRFRKAGDGELAVVKNLNLTGLMLNNFIVDHLVFESCILDKVSFRQTEFVFETSFINCSLKNTDFRDTHAASVLFYNSNLEDCFFSEHAAWMSVDLDDNIIPSYFINCRMSPGVIQRVSEDGGVILSSLSDADQKTQDSIKWRLKAIEIAPVLKF